MRCSHVIAYAYHIKSTILVTAVAVLVQPEPISPGLGWREMETAVAKLMHTMPFTNDLISYAQTLPITPSAG